MFTGALCCGAIALAGIAGQALAAQPCPMTYETFEIAVPHIDLTSCPEKDGKGGIFCRATVGGDRVHIFYFSEADDQCLQQVKSFSDESYTLAVTPK
jgi:hypothetical protein